TKTGDIILKPGLVYHHYFWHANQFDERIVTQDKGLLLPEFKGEYKPLSSTKLVLNYHMRSRFTEAGNYANRLRLLNFNSLFRGNEKLENSVYHDLFLSYRYFDVVSRLNYNLNFSYRRQEKSIRQTTTLEGIDQISTPVYTDLPENTVGINGGISRVWGNFKPRLNAGIRLAEIGRASCREGGWR